MDWTSAMAMHNNKHALHGDAIMGEMSMKSIHSNANFQKHVLFGQENMPIGLFHADFKLGCAVNPGHPISIFFG